jgi:hypothetical protein
MERIRELIDKLYQQKEQNSSPAQLLLTVQQLQAELARMQQRNGTLGTSKVAVTLPMNISFSEEVSSPEIPEVKKEMVAPPPPPPPPPPMQDKIEYSIPKPLFGEPPPPVPAPPPLRPINPAFEQAENTGKFTPAKEIHEVIAEKKESLNDRLKQEKTEVVHTLKDSPIKDLRKGIGINDRFTFVNELFRGDEAMYERSIKTINGFHILSEAEYWINRELKVKLGWNDNKDLVQHFYHLVRRRFS